MEIRHFALAILISLSAISSYSANAQTSGACPEFEQAHGPTIVFSTNSSYQRYGFQSFHEKPGKIGSVEYSALSGKRGKITGRAVDVNEILHYDEVIVDDCSRVYWEDLDNDPASRYAWISGVIVLDDVQRDGEHCEDYKRANGRRILFSTDKLYKDSGFVFFRGNVDGDKSVPYEAVAGREAKVLGVSDGGAMGSFKTYEVLLGNCDRVYWWVTGSDLGDKDAASSGVFFLR